MKRSQALNYTPKAIEALRSHPCPGAPITRATNRWVADLLEQAEVFVLPDCGELLDRSKPKPEVPGLMFKPPFPVVALEYSALRPSRMHDFYTAIPCSRRIALAWEWTGDMPALLRAGRDCQDIGPGVAVLSVFYADAAETWVANSAASHFAYDGEWQDRTTHSTPFMQAMIDRGEMTAANLRSRGFETSFIPLALEQLVAATQALGSKDAAIDAARADNNDECNAYFDLCYALACKNVTTERTAQSHILNRERRRKGKPELKDFHVLSLGGGDSSGAAQIFGDRSGPRSHLRRGHIRRLGPDRITWVNQTMVHGHGGFVDKSYRMKGVA